MTNLIISRLINKSTFWANISSEAKSTDISLVVGVPNNSKKSDCSNLSINSYSNYYEQFAFQLSKSETFLILGKKLDKWSSNWNIDFVPGFTMRNFRQSDRLLITRQSFIITIKRYAESCELCVFPIRNCSSPKSPLNPFMRRADSSSQFCTAMPNVQ